MKASFRHILAVLAVIAALVSCAKDPAPGMTDTGYRQADGLRTISLTFGSRTKTTLEGYQPLFAQDDSVLLSNGYSIDTCGVTVTEDSVTINTYLHGLLTAVYPYKAARLSNNKIDGVLIPSAQSGKFADANICLARMTKINENVLSFNNKTAVLRFYVDKSISVKSITISSSEEIAEDGAGSNTSITVDAGDRNTLDKVTDDSGKRICYVAVKPGVNAKSLSFSSVTTTQGESPVERTSSADITLDAGKLYNAFIPYYVNVKVSDSPETYQRWGYCNVGAFLPEEPGEYFAWGEVCGHTPVQTVFTFPGDKPSDDRYPDTWAASSGFAPCNTPYRDNSSYKKYNSTDSQTKLDPLDDAATANWGGNWRMPTDAELEALATAQKVWVDSTKGYCFGTEPCTVLLPVTGYGEGKNLKNGEQSGAYWSSLVSDGSGVFDQTEEAFCLLLTNPNANAIIPDVFDILSATSGSGVNIYRTDRFYGLAVRPIRTNGDLPND